MNLSKKEIELYERSWTLRWQARHKKRPTKRVPLRAVPNSSLMTRKSVLVALTDGKRWRRSLA